MEGEPVLPKLEREQEQDEPFLDSAALTPTEEVASAFRQIKGATVTVIKRSKKDSKKQGRKAKKVKLIITSKKSTVLEDKEETPKKKTTKPKKVKLVITGKRRDDPKPAKPVSPPLNPPDWPDFDEEEEHEEDEDLENAYFDEDEFDPNEVLRKAELDRASRKHKQDEKSSLESDLQIKEENLLADGASNVPPDSVVDDIKIEGEDVFQSPDFYPDPVEDEDDEEELVPKKRSRRAPKRHRAVEDEEDFEDLELRNELAELNGLEPPLGKKRKRGPGRPPKNDQAPRTRGTKTVGPAALEEYEGEIEMTAVTLDAYVVNKAGKKTFPRLNKMEESVNDEEGVTVKTEDDAKEAVTEQKDEISQSDHDLGPPKSRDRFMYGCSFCPFVGRKQKWLLHLKNSHAHRNLLFCSHSRLCSMPFTCPVSLEKHVALMHKERFQCDLCLKEFRFRSQLKQHMVVHLGEEEKEKAVHICPYCGKNFQTRTGFRSHEAHYHTKILRHKCEWEDCGKAFFNKNELTIHMRLHTKELPFTCSYCGSGFVSRSRMIHHEKAMHLGVGKVTVKCEICQKMIRKKDIVYHVKTHKGLNKDWCSFCGKEFNSKGAKKRHEKIHTSDKKHSCSYCGKSFVQKVNMESHERIHTGVKPYKCRFCGEGFVQGTRRNQHQASCPQRSQEAAEAAVASVQQPQDPSLLLQQHEALVEFKT